MLSQCSQQGSSCLHSEIPSEQEDATAGQMLDRELHKNWRSKFHEIFLPKLTKSEALLSHRMFSPRDLAEALAKAAWDLPDSKLWVKLCVGTGRGLHQGSHGNLSSGFLAIQKLS